MELREGSHGVGSAAEVKHVHLDLAEGVRAVDNHRHRAHQLAETLDGQDDRGDGGDVGEDRGAEGRGAAVLGQGLADRGQHGLLGLESGGLHLDADQLDGVDLDEVGQHTLHHALQQ